MSAQDYPNVVIDLSHFNEVESFEEIQQGGIVGVIHKATEGTGGVDPTYAGRKPQALGAGLWWGAYHFGVGADGTQQAQYFLSVVQPGPQDLLALDFEQNPDGPTMTIEQAEQFVTEIYNQTGRYPGFYSDALAGSLLGDSVSSVLANCWLWRAEYGAAPIVPPTWPTWTMWQYTESGTVPGLSGACDRDKFNGSLQGLARLWGHGE
jgi:lysozyme